jgi:hypothetical protein
MAGIKKYVRILYFHKSTKYLNSYLLLSIRIYFNLKFQYGHYHQGLRSTLLRTILISEVQRNEVSRQSVDGNIRTSVRK